VFVANFGNYNENLAAPSTVQKETEAEAVSSHMAEVMGNASSRSPFADHSLRASTLHFNCLIGL